MKRNTMPCITSPIVYFHFILSNDVADKTPVCDVFVYHLGELRWKYPCRLLGCCCQCYLHRHVNYLHCSFHGVSYCSVCCYVYLYSTFPWLFSDVTGFFGVGLPRLCVERCMTVECLQYLLLLLVPSSYVLDCACEPIAPPLTPPFPLPIGYST